MTEYEVKKKLQGLRNTKRYIEMLQQEKRSFISSKQLAPNYGGCGGGSRTISDKTASVTIIYENKLKAIERELKKEQEEYGTLLQAVECLTSDFKLIIKQRYISGKTLRQIANRADYTAMTVLRKEKEAIKEISKIILNNVTNVTSYML